MYTQVLYLYLPCLYTNNAVIFSLDLFTDMRSIVVNRVRTEQFIKYVQVYCARTLKKYFSLTTQIWFSVCVLFVSNIFCSLSPPPPDILYGVAPKKIIMVRCASFVSYSMKNKGIRKKLFMCSENNVNNFMYFI